MRFKNFSCVYAFVWFILLGSTMWTGETLGLGGHYARMNAKARSQSGEDDYDAELQAEYYGYDDDGLPVPAKHGDLRDKRHSAMSLGSKVSISEKFESIQLHSLIPDNYDRMRNPNNKDGSPLIIRTSIGIGKLQEVDEDRKGITFEMFLELAWKENRLNMSEIMRPTDILPLPLDMLSLIWIPDPFIHNMKSLKSARVAKPTRGLQLRGDGTVIFTIMGNAEIGCEMNFEEYPVDTQICPVTLESFAYNVHENLYLWNSNVSTYSDLMTEDFIVHLVQRKEFNNTYLDSTLWNGQTFSRLEFRLILQRKYDYHLLQTYVPSLLFVCCSWLSFLVPRDAIPGRMALCVTTVLSITAMFAAIQQVTPHSQYIKALDLWMLVSIMFVFYGLLAYLIAIKLANMGAAREKARVDKEARERALTPSTLSPARHPPMSESLNAPLSPQQRKTWIERNSVGNAGVGQESPVDPKDHQDVFVPPVPAGPKLKRRFHISPSRWTQAADWFEFLSFTLWPIAFGAFSAWYWAWLLREAEEYKEYLNQPD